MCSIVLLRDRHHYYLYSGNTDMRKQFDGLCGIVRNELGQEMMIRDVLFL